MGCFAFGPPTTYLNPQLLRYCQINSILVPRTKDVAQIDHSSHLGTPTTLHNIDSKRLSSKEET
jgi:hypothetical protein